MASSTGELFFGTLEGLISFFPERLEQNSFIPPVYITYIKHKNDEASGELYDKGTNSGYLQAKQITLQHDQNSIELGFVALSYACPAANQYAYKMENLDKDWIFTRDNQSVTYANLASRKIPVCCESK